MTIDRQIPGLDDAVFEVPRDEQNRIVFSLQGESKTWKSTFPLSGPSPQVVFDIDDRLEGVVNPWMRGEMGHPPKAIRRVGLRMPKVDIRSRKPDSVVQAEAEREWVKFVDGYHKALKSSLKPGGVRVISIDTATDLIDLRLLSEFGRLTSIEPWARGQTYLEMATLIREGEKYDASCIWIHSQKDERKTVKKINNKGQEVEDSVPTGNRILDGYRKTHECVQVCLLSEMDKKGRGQIKVIRSGLNALTNLKTYTAEDWGDPIEDPDDYIGPFAWIAKQTYPRTKFKDWMDKE